MTASGRRTLEDHEGQFVPDALCVAIQMAKFSIERDFWLKKESERGWVEKLIEKVWENTHTQKRLERIAELDRKIHDPRAVLDEIVTSTSVAAMRAKPILRVESILMEQLRLIPKEQLIDLLDRYGIQADPQNPYRTVRDLPPCESQMVVGIAIENLKHRFEQPAMPPACQITDHRISEELGMQPEVLAEMKHVIAGEMCVTPQGNAVAPVTSHTQTNPQPRSLP